MVRQYRVMFAFSVSSPGSSSLLTVPDRLDSSRYTPMPGATPTLMSPDAALTSARGPDAASICTSPLAVRTVTPPLTWPIRTSPDAVSTSASAAESTDTSPEAVSIRTWPLTRPALTSPLAEWTSRAPSSPVPSKSAEAVLTRHDEPSGSSTTASTEPSRPRPDWSGTMTDSVPSSNSTRVAARIRSLPSSVTVAVCVAAAATAMSPAGRRICRLTGSGAGYSQEGMT
jgi:hypothetical protein